MADYSYEFPATVMLIDTPYLNLAIHDLKQHFEQALQRKLQKINITNLMAYFALDARASTADNEIQIILVHDSDTQEIAHSQPPYLLKKLDGMAFQSNQKEFFIATVSSEEIINYQNLYIDLLQMLGETEEIKKIIIIPATEEYGEGIANCIKGIQDKEIIWFRMDNPQESFNFQPEVLAYPIMGALGIKGDEVE